MLKFRHYIFCLSVIFIASMSAHAQFEFSYEKNTFINYFNCLGIYSGTSLDAGEKVWFFSSGQFPAVGKIIHVIRTKEAQKRFDVLGFDKVYSDKLLWAELGCVHSFRGNMPESLARMSPEPKNSDPLGLAVRGLPASAWISKGKGDPVSMNIKVNPY